MPGPATSIDLDADTPALPNPKQNDSAPSDSGPANKGPSLMDDLDRKLSEHFGADEINDTPGAVPEDKPEDDKPSLSDKPEDKPADDKPAEKPEDKPADDKPAEKPEDKPEEVSSDFEEFSIEDITEDKPADDKPAEKPEDKFEVSDDEVPQEVKDQGDKAAARWKELKAAEKENEALKQQLEDLRTQSNSDEIDALKKQLEEKDKTLAEWEKELSVTRVEATPEYAEKVNKPLEQLEVSIRELFVDPAQGDEAISALLLADRAERSAKISDLAEGLNEMDRTALYQQVREVEGVFKTRDELSANASEALKRFEQERLAKETQTAEQRKAALQTVTETVWDRLKEKVPGLTDETGNLKPEFAQLKEQVKGQDLRQMQDSTLAFSASAAYLLPKVTKQLSDQIATQNAEITQLKASIAKLTGSTPGGGTGNADLPEDSGDGSFADRIDRAIESGQVTFG